LTLRDQYCVAGEEITPGETLSEATSRNTDLDFNPDPICNYNPNSHPRPKLG